MALPSSVAPPPVLTEGARDLTRAQLALIRRTVAKDCNQDEFDLFIEICKQKRLNPMTRQIYGIVTHRNKPDKRQLVVVTGIDGYRSIADRTGRYRPADQRAAIDYVEALKDPLNPLGIESAAVTVYKQDDLGVWNGVVGIAYWDEFAPIEDVWGEDPKSGKRRPTGEKKLGDMWAKMPRNQIIKCAEAQALRKGWPEDCGGIYVTEELDRARVNETASEAAEAAEAEDRARRIGLYSDSVPIVWGASDPIVMVPLGQLADRILGHLRTLPTVAEIDGWNARNRESMRQFWAKSKGEALAVKKEIDAARAKLAATPTIDGNSTDDKAGDDKADDDRPGPSAGGDGRLI